MAPLRLCLLLTALAFLLAETPCARAEEEGFKDKLAKCFTLEWAKGFLPCMIGKFDNLIPALQDILESLPISASTGTGRRLLSRQPWDSFLPPRPATVTNKYHAFSRSMEHLHDEFQEAVLDELTGFRAHTKEERTKAMVFRQLAQMNTSQLLGEYTTVATRTLVELRALATTAVTQVGQSQDGYAFDGRTYSAGGASTYALTDVLTQLAGLLSGVCDSFLEQGHPLVGEECVNLVDIVTCIATYDVASLEDSIEWTQCIYQCRDLPQISSCVTEQFTTNLKCELPWPVKDISWVAPITIRAFTALLKLDDCTINVKSPAGGSSVTLAEGGLPQNIEFSMYMPPAALCVDLGAIKTPLGVVKGIVDLIRNKIGDCPVEVHLASQSFLDFAESKIPKVPFVITTPNIPTCRSGKMRRLVVFGWHDHADATVGAGRMAITQDNWNDTFTVPVVATTDSKPSVPKEGLQNSLVIRLKVGLFRMQNITRFPLTVTEEDTNDLGETSCYSLGGHMITFGQSYYNNYYEGHFYLYKSNKHSYEVQGAYQRCSPNENVTCACGVAVRFDDNVFVVDQCRRQNTPCLTQDCEPVTRAILYQNGQVSSNVRIYRTDGGLKFNVLLPYGTFITIAVVGKNVNTVIRPSAADKHSSLGLCDVYTNVKGNTDLTLPDGQSYTLTAGTLPRNFTTAWRVPPESSLLQGALRSDSQTDVGGQPYCSCTHVLYMGSVCNCGDDYHTEYCDMNATYALYPEDDMTDEVSQIAVPSVKQYMADTGEHVGHDVDIDTDYVPENPSQLDVVISERSAKVICEAMIANDPAVAQCKSPNFFGKCQGMGLSIAKPITYSAHTQACVDEIMAANSTSTDQLFFIVQTVRQKCLDRMYQLCSNDDKIKSVVDLACPGNCHGQGACKQGVCACNAGFAGPDCSLVSQADPVFAMPETLLCDSRGEDCTWIKIFGYNFQQTSRISVNAEQLEVTSEGAFNTGDSSTSTAVVISPHQAAAKLSSPGSYSLHVTVEGGHNFHYTQIAYDALCYQCDVLDKTCHRKQTKDHCLVEGVCVPNGFISSKDDCYICDAHQLTDDWSVVGTSFCKSHHASIVTQQEQDMRIYTIRVVVAVVLSAGIVIATIVLYILIGRRTQTVKEKKVAFETRKSQVQLVQDAAAYDGHSSYVMDGAIGGVANPNYHSEVSIVSDADYQEAL